MESGWNSENFKIEMIKVKDLNKAEWNYKEDDAEMGMKLVHNIKRNGILVPSIVYNDDGKLTVIDGNHRLDAYRYLEILQVPCVNLGEISLNEARRIAIEINETKFDADRLKLAEALHDIKLEFDEDDLKLTLPFGNDELEQFEALIDLDLEDDGEEQVQFTRRKKEVCCPKCNFNFKV